MEVIIVILFCKRMGENSLLKLEEMNLCGNCVLTFTNIQTEIEGI